MKIDVILGDSSAPTVLPPVAPAAPAPLVLEEIPPALLAELRSRLASLPPFYRACLGPEDSQRLDKLLAAGKGKAEDLDFLRFRVTTQLNQGAQEFAEFPGHVVELEAKLGEGGATIDTLRMKDGRKIEGTVEEETEEYVKLKSRFGSAKLPKTDIAGIDRGKGSTVEFKSRYAAAKGKKEELVALLAWSKERNLPKAAELVSWAVLVLDPGHERCRTELGLPRTPGVASADPSVQVREGKIEWNGRLFTPDELRRELTSLGFVQVNGLWCEKVPKTFRIDNLYRDEGKYLILGGGAAIQARTQMKDDTLYDVATRSWVTRPKMVVLGRYLGTGGTPLAAVGAPAPAPAPVMPGSGSGMIHIQVEAPGDIVECRIRARSQVLRTGDTVTVSVASDPSDSQAKMLYTLAAPNDISPTHDATDKVRGLTRFCIRAQTTGTGMFLPCDSGTQGVLEVRYSYGKPLERLNTALGCKREINGVAAAQAPPPLKLDGDQIAERSIAAAAQTAALRPTLPEALAEMRRQTENMVLGREVPIPPRYLQVASSIRDPLTPHFEEVSREMLTSLYGWWAALPPAEKVDFSNFYGQWCARMRLIQRGLK